MLFVYSLEDRQPYSERVDSIFDKMAERGDLLCTSTFTVGELLVGPRKRADQQVESRIFEILQNKDIALFTFDIPAATAYGAIRAANPVTPADAIHLASAAANGVDLFLTNDRTLKKLQIRHRHNRVWVEHRDHPAEP